jgi:Zn-dependent protease
VIDRYDVMYFVALVASIIVHEVAHGVVALWHGDDTAKRAGRLTLNPVPHIDPLGSIILPAMAVLGGLPAFGWAKPVPVNPSLLRNRRRDLLRVGLAGPGINILLMVVFALAARFTLRPDGIRTFASFDDAPIYGVFFFYLAVVNLFLAAFNLLPIPPLDGASLLERLVPARKLGWYHQMAPYGMLIIFGLVFFTNIFGRLVDPLLRNLAEFVLG